MTLLKVVTTFLIAASVLSGCSGFPKYPNKQVYRAVMHENMCMADGQIDPTKAACIKYILRNPETFEFDCERGEDQHCIKYPLMMCNGVFGYQNQDIAPMIEWGMDVVDHAAKHCKAK